MPSLCDWRENVKKLDKTRVKSLSVFLLSHLLCSHVLNSRSWSTWKLFYRQAKLSIDSNWVVDVTVWNWRRVNLFLLSISRSEYNVMFSAFSVVLFPYQSSREPQMMIKLYTDVWVMFEQNSHELNGWKLII